MSNNWFSPWTTPKRDDGYGFKPEHLNLRALYDYRSVDATGYFDQSGNGVAQATVGAGANSPLYLPYTAPMVYVPAGGGSNGVTSSAVAGFRNATEFDVRTVVDLDSWSAGPVAFAMSHGGASAPVSTFRFWFNAAQVTLDLSNGGGAYTSISGAHGRSGISCIRGIWRSSDGFTAVQAKATTAATAIADMQSNSGWSTIFSATRLAGDRLNSAAPDTNLGVGRYGTSGSNPLDGKVYCAQFSTVIDGTPFAFFDPGRCSQSGYTDGMIAWTITRGTTAANRKTVIQSPQANSAKSLYLFAADDYIDLPAASIPTFGAGATGTAITVIRRWDTQPLSAIFSTRPSNSGADLFQGVGLRQDSASTNMRLITADGVTVAQTGALAVAIPSLAIVAVEKTPSLIQLRNVVAGTTVNVAHANLNMATGAAGRLGAQTGIPTAYADMELVAHMTMDFVPSAAMYAQIVSFYGS